MCRLVATSSEYGGSLQSCGTQAKATILQRARRRKTETYVQINQVSANYRVAFRTLTKDLYKLLRRT